MIHHAVLVHERFLEAIEGGVVYDWLLALYDELIDVMTDYVNLVVVLIELGEEIVVYLSNSSHH